MTVQRGETDMLANVCTTLVYIDVLSYFEVCL